MCNLYQKHKSESLEATNTNCRKLIWFRRGRNQVYKKFQKAQVEYPNISTVSLQGGRKMIRTLQFLMEERIFWVKEMLRQWQSSKNIGPETELRPCSIFVGFLSAVPEHPREGCWIGGKISKDQPLNIFHNLKYASQIDQVEKEICSFLQHHLPTYTLLDVKDLITDLKMFSLGSLKQSSNVSKLTNDPHENAMMLEQMVADEGVG